MPAITTFPFDPLFNNYAAGDLTLNPSSPSINSGNNSFSASLVADLAGAVPRFWRRC